MINIFFSEYHTRLREWHNLKDSLSEVDISIICVTVDQFWQQCPLVNHYLHPADIQEWPNPWELIKDNTYCIYARALGMFYTLVILGLKNVDIYNGLDDNNENVVLIVVNENYVLNWYPNQVLNTDLTEFKQLVKLDTTELIKKIGEE